VSELQQIIETAFEDRAKLTPQNTPITVKEAIYETIELLDSGQLRVAEKSTIIGK